MTMGIMLISAFIAFVVTNVYYHYSLKPKNDEKITVIAEKTAEMIKNKEKEDIAGYLSSLTDLGYQFYLVDQQGNKELYGDAFRLENLKQTDIDSVLNGEIYHGIANYPWKPFVTGFFDNELTNTVGVPLEIGEETEALFVRPNALLQFGEMRFFLAALIVLVMFLSFLLILISTIFIVRPIKKLTEATKKIAAGNHHLKLNVHRRDEIGRLANNFMIMSNHLERTEEVRQEFVSNVSHEIQSPLTSIQGFSQALREEELPEEMRQSYLEIIEKESRRMSELSKQLLTLSFLDSGLIQEEYVSFDLEKQLKEVVLSTEWQWHKKKLAIELELFPYEINGNPRLLQQVWMNLLTNAIRYTNEGGRVHIRMTKERHGVIVTVKDTGIGINSEDIPRLFDRFYKVDKARTRTENSTGLGLSIVEKIIHLHKGNIMVTSEQGQGSQFEVFLPNQ